MINFIHPNQTRLNNMKTPQKTKEQLIEELANLKHDYEILLTNDQIRRKEFAKAFTWYKAQHPYSCRNESEPQIPSWEQVFVNIGFLTAQRDFRNYEGNVSELECKLEDLEKRLLKNVNPNL